MMWNQTRNNANRRVIVALGSARAAGAGVWRQAAGLTWQKERKGLTEGPSVRWGNVQGSRQGWEDGGRKEEGRRKK